MLLMMLLLLLLLLLGLSPSLPRSSATVPLAALVPAPGVRGAQMRRPLLCLHEGQVPWVGGMCISWWP